MPENGARIFRSPFAINRIHVRSLGSPGQKIGVASLATPRGLQPLAASARALPRRSSVAPPCLPVVLTSRRRPAAASCRRARACRPRPPPRPAAVRRPLCARPIPACRRVSRLLLPKRVDGGAPTFTHPGRHTSANSNHPLLAPASIPTPGTAPPSSSRARSFAVAIASRVRRPLTCGDRARFGRSGAALCGSRNCAHGPQQRLEFSSPRLTPLPSAARNICNMPVVAPQITRPRNANRSG